MREAFGQGATTIQQAHTYAAAYLMTNSVFINKASAASTVQDMQSAGVALSLAQESIKPGVFNETPLEDGTISSRAIGPDTQVMIIYGAPNPWEKRSDRFKPAALTLRDDIQSRFKTHVSVVAEPTRTQLSKAFHDMASTKPDIKPHAVIIFMCHGGSDNAKNAPNLAQYTEGAIQLSDNEAHMTEKEIKTEINTKIAPAFKTVEIAFETCHSGVWIR